MKIKNIMGISFILGGIIKFLTLKSKKRIPKMTRPTYTRTQSDMDYIEVETAYNKPNFRRPNHPNDNVIRSPDGNA